VGGRAYGRLPEKRQGVQPVSLNMNVWLDQVLEAILSLIRLVLSSFAGLIQRVSDAMGPLGLLGLYLFLTLFGLWLAYQLLRILSLIVLRILLPVAAFLVTLLVLALLIS
jgi:hypothetical protein